jgi:hypothetical protein
MTAQSCHISMNLLLKPLIIACLSSVTNLRIDKLQRALYGYWSKQHSSCANISSCIWAITDYHLGKTGFLRISSVTSTEKKAGYYHQIRNDYAHCFLYVWMSLCFQHQHHMELYIHMLCAWFAPAIIQSLGCKNANFRKPILTPGREYLKWGHDPFKLYNNNHFCSCILKSQTLIDM